ncbi:MAG: CHASE2 domain-containing protein [Treponema sp.]|nr:CHASE2 domain-containing protein [Treponema sp.]
MVFVDVDDVAIAHVGVFPWPRSVVADGLLRLKEYGVQSAVFDIEYIDKSPPGLDAVYLDRSLPGDFKRSFDGISTDVKNLIDAVSQGRISPRETAEIGPELAELIDSEREALLNKTAGIARDNDEYLAQAAALLGSAWLTVNLQQDVPLEGEQASRRPLAEEKFSYPVDAAPGVFRGNDIDVLPTILPLMEAAKGAGFTNVTIDDDGVRRRIYLAREVNDHWYLQLAFAPLMDYLGNPAIRYTPGKIVLEQARIPGAAGGSGTIKDITIPLDKNGAMMLDWPPTSYLKSYTHLSFGYLSYLEEYLQQLEDCVSVLSSLDVWFYSDSDDTLFYGLNTLTKLEELFSTLEEKRRASLAENSDELFNEYLAVQEEIGGAIQEFLALGTRDSIQNAVERLINEYPEQADLITNEGEYALSYIDSFGALYADIQEIEGILESALRGKICIIGRSDTGTTDIGVNPFWGQYVNVGTHAVVMDTILSQSFLTPMSKLWSIIITMIIAPLIIILITGFKPGVRISIGLGGAVLLFGAALILFRYQGIYFGPLGPVLTVVIAVILRETIAFISSEREKQVISKTVSTYVSGELVKRIIADPSLLKLGGEKRHMTAIFTDIQGFSGISEQLNDPEKLVKLLNNYLTAMSDVAMAQQGTIDKYEGDAIIAFFGTAWDEADHAKRACMAAVLMKRAEAELNKSYVENKLSPTPLLTRIGINSGPMVLGNMGTEKKMDYTVMGNAVNLAARLEGVNKQYGTWILASEETKRETGDTFLWRRLDRVRVVNILEPVQLWELIDTADNADDAITEKVRIFHEALSLFEAKDWESALEAFTQVLSRDSEDKPAKKFVKRCQEYIKIPPTKSWDGVYNLTEK